LPQGVSFNSYLIEDEKIALIDTVEIGYSDVFFRKIKSIIGDKKIDYLVVNHMEPDHSGSIDWLVTQYPDIQIIGNNRTADMLKGFYGITNNIILIKDQEEISLGQNTLKFYLTPMVHWPETMMTYVPEKEALFSGDVFGTFGTLDGGIMDSQLKVDRYWDEMIRYYSNVMGKYGSSVQTALKKISGEKFRLLCSTHGPVWKEEKNISKVISLYDQLSRYEALENGLVIAYGSMYGNTERLAEVIAAGASEIGLCNIVLHNVSKSHQSDILRDIFKYNGLIIGSPTYNNKLYPSVESLIDAIQGRNIKNRFFGYFGGYSWAGAAVKNLREFSEKMEFEVVSSPIEMKQSLDGTTYELAFRLGKEMAEKLLSNEPVHSHKANC
jgi:flavorubredoxin